MAMFAVMFPILGVYPALTFGVLRVLFAVIVTVRENGLFFQQLPFQATNEFGVGKTNDDGTIMVDYTPRPFSHLVKWSFIFLTMAVVLSVYVTMPLLAQTLHVLWAASAITSTSALMSVMTLPAVLETTALFIQVCTYAPLTLGVAVEGIGLVMPEKAWRAYTDFEFKHLVKPELFVKRCFNNKPEELSAHPVMQV